MQQLTGHTMQICYWKTAISVVLFLGSATAASHAI